MSITGTIIDGQVKLDGPIQWQGGMPVRLTQRMDRPPYDEEAELAGWRVLREMAARHNML